MSTLPIPSQPDKNDPPKKPKPDKPKFPIGKFDQGNRGPVQKPTRGGGGMSNVPRRTNNSRGR